MSTSRGSSIEPQSQSNDFASLNWAHTMNLPLSHEELLAETQAGRELLAFLRSTPIIAYDICFRDGYDYLVWPSTGVAIDMAYNIRFADQSPVHPWWQVDDEPEQHLRSSTRNRFRNLVAQLFQVHEMPISILWMVAGDESATLDFSRYESADEALRALGRNHCFMTDSCLTQER